MLIDAAFNIRVPRQRVVCMRQNGRGTDGRLARGES